MLLLSLPTVTSRFLLLVTITMTHSPVPKPVPFAIMRSGHEVIRGAMLDVAAALEKDDYAEAKSMWVQLHRWDDLHKRMEEGGDADSSPIGLFRLLDEHCQQVTETEDLRGWHDRLYEYEEDVDDAFRKDDITYVKDLYPIFHKENLAHLEAEEKVFMPR